MGTTARMKTIEDRRTRALERRLLVACFARWRDECRPPEPPYVIAVVPLVLRLCFNEWRAVTPRRVRAPEPVIKPRPLRLPPPRHFKTTYMCATRSSQLRSFRPSRYHKPVGKVSPRQQLFIDRQVNNRRGPEIPPLLDLTLPRLVEPPDWEWDEVVPLRMPWVH